ncbi:MAG: fused MFS/spermidine synthase [Nitratireductor sp.]|nr:fused MFS/spermidine synthase [Nitratireductor sp.]
MEHSQKALGTDANSVHAVKTAILPVFVATIFLSAFLLFSVQPFFAKMVLPRLGGSPGVWSVAMVFFQTVLLLGYGYAHLLTKYLKPRNAVLFHACILAAALLFQPIAIPAGWEVPPQSGQSIWLLGLFAVAVGLPFFAVSANGPLLQAWFSRTGHDHAADPYFLYGSSNIGSFASLILYIIAFEPLQTIGDQSRSWTVGYLMLAGLVMVCGAIMLARAPSPAMLPSERSDGSRDEAPASRKDRFQWVALAAIPSGLLVAVTAHVSVDIAAAPFLWVIPLALFLLTFVLAFARRQIVAARTIASILPWLSALGFITFVVDAGIPVWMTLGLHLALFFCVALLAHMVLVSKRPPANDLTGFYLWMSFGGVIGGALTALASPLAFNSVAEYPLLIVGALLIWPLLGPDTVRGRNFHEIASLGLVAAFISVVVNIPAIRTLVMPAEPGFYTVAIAAFALASAVAIFRSTGLHIFFAVMSVGLYFALQSASGSLFAERSFFGVVKAYPSDQGRFVVMAHGTTEHGAMRTSDRNGKPVPITYYHESGTIADTLFAAQEKIDGREAEMGLVGLGTGSMLCHRKPAEKWTAYEIDSSVVSVASNSSLFGFISECGTDTPIVLGDARITLADEPVGKFDYLLLDAFSSDSIPVHLLTAEALELYRSRLKQDGMLAIHISNRYMELRSVLASLARNAGMVGRAAIFLPPEHLREGEHVNPAEVVVLANRESDLGRIARDSRWQMLEDEGTTAWTDDYSNILAAILRRQWD